MQHVQLRLVGPITAYGGQTYVTSQTGTGSTFVMQNAPTLTGMPVVSSSDTTAFSNTTFFNGTFVGAVVHNTTSTTNAVTGIGFYGGANGNSVAGIAMVQSTANSIGDLVLAAGGSGRSSTVPEGLRIAGATGAVTIGGSLTANSLAVTTTTTFSGIATVSAANAQLRVDRSATGAGKYAFFGWYTAGAVKWQAGIDGDLSDSTWTLWDNAASVYAVKVATGGAVTLASSLAITGALTGVTSLTMSGALSGATSVNQVATASATAQSADLAKTTLYAVTADGWYQLAGQVTLTRQATTTSTLPNVRFYWTDPNTAVESATLATNTGSNGIIADSFIPNAQGKKTISMATVYAKSGTNISYDTVGYVNNGATTMQFAVQLSAWRIG